MHPRKIDHNSSVNELTLDLSRDWKISIDELKINTDLDLILIQLFEAAGNLKSVIETQA